MRFEWNEAKNRSNIRKHGFDFTDGKELFLGGNPLLVAPDVRRSTAKKDGAALARSRRESWLWCSLSVDQA